MKKCFLLSTVLLFQVVLIAQSKERYKYCDSSGCIGDVKYSILAPDTFLTINGNGWRLMNGDSIIGTKLNQLYSVTKIPDARGIFLRGMNSGREDGFQNPENKNVGEPQPDALKEHVHSFGLRRIAVGTAGGEIGVSNVEGNEPDQITFSHIKYTDKAIREPVTSSNKPLTNDYSGQRRPSEVLTSSETRPKNISLFIYIKVDINTKKP